MSRYLLNDPRLRIMRLVLIYVSVFRRAFFPVELVNRLLSLNCIVIKQQCIFSKIHFWMVLSSNLYLCFRSNEHIPNNLCCTAIAMAMAICDFIYPSRMFSQISLHSYTWHSTVYKVSLSSLSVIIMRYPHFLHSRTCLLYTSRCV